MHHQTEIPCIKERLTRYSCKRKSRKTRAKKKRKNEGNEAEYSILEKFFASDGNRCCWNSARLTSAPKKKKNKKEEEEQKKKIKEKEEKVILHRETILRQRKPQLVSAITFFSRPTLAALGISHRKFHGRGG